MKKIGLQMKEKSTTVPFLLFIDIKFIYSSRPN